jgi:hypothetical protein
VLSPGLLVAWLGLAGRAGFRIELMTNDLILADAQAQLDQPEAAVFPSPTSTSRQRCKRSSRQRRG